MGPISKKLTRRFAKWSGQFRQRATSISIPKDLHDVESLVKKGHDPLHAVYISVQNSASVFSECVSALHHQFDAIVLAGIPDVKESLPHA